MVFFFDKHIHPHGHFNGLYVLHKPSEHVEWKILKAQKKEKKSGGSSAAPAADKADNATADKLTVDSRLKEVLCSRMMLSDNDADKLCTEVTGQVN